MKSFAELKRELQVGTKLRMIHPKTNRLCGIEREIVKVQTNAIVMSKPDNGKSWLEWPKSAKLVETTENGFRIYTSGKRDMTPEEKRVWDNRPQDPEQARIDIMTDTSTMFWREKSYFKNAGMEHLLAYNTGSKRRDYKTLKIIDAQVRGELMLEYEYVGG